LTLPLQDEVAERQIALVISLAGAIHGLLGEPAVRHDGHHAIARLEARHPIAAGRHDGSNESIHYADPSYVAPNAPLLVRRSGTTVHDATFWQPLASSRTQVQAFVDAQWGRVRTFAGSVRVGKPPFGDPSNAAYKRAAIAVLRATAGTKRPPVDTSPLAWNEVAAAAATGVLAQVAAHGVHRVGP